MSLSEEPARKIFVKQCTNLIIDNKLELSKRHRKWKLIKNKTISVGLVWIQGVIINVSESHDIVTVDDGTGTILITGIKDAPGVGSWIQKGLYLMVIGELLTTTPDVKIRAVKLTQLLEPNAEILWITEVLDFWKFMDCS